LLHLRYTKVVKAEDGEAGVGKLMTGAQGKDAIIEVPLGTVIKNADTGQIIYEINEDAQEFILLHGGRGGKGNNFLKVLQGKLLNLLSQVKIVKLVFLFSN